MALSIRGLRARLDHRTMIQHVGEVFLQTRYLAALAGDLGGARL
jgi:hypothetical protein